MTLHFLNKQETDEILESLEKQFGITKIDGIILKIGQERIFLYQGSLSVNQIKELEREVPIERIGVYFAKMQDGGIRLSIEGTHIFKDQIKKNFFIMNDAQLIDWMHGSELLVNSEKKGFLVMKHKEDLLGTGKASAEKITNFIPKTRRLKNKS
jgi:NOL1/NOP2/fmu family ribosome biogenesis protein